MRNVAAIQDKIFTLPALIQRIKGWRTTGKTIAFTNGVFDLLHEGHIYSLSMAAREADYLVVGLNADSSVKRLKGESRPIHNQQSRSLILASLLIVDAVVMFEEDTPHTFITSLLPDVLVKGGGYTVDNIVGAKEVIANGGRVAINPIAEGLFTTATISKMQQL